MRVEEIRQVCPGRFQQKSVLVHTHDRPGPRRRLLPSNMGIDETPYCHPFVEHVPGAAYGNTACGRDHDTSIAECAAEVGTLRIYLHTWLLHDQYVDRIRPPGRARRCWGQAGPRDVASVLGRTGRRSVFPTVPVELPTSHSGRRVRICLLRGRSLTPS